MYLFSDYIESDSDTVTRFSSCRTYRYTLWRVWGNPENFVQFIGLNPSTADEFHNDPTIRRCINFAKSWGFEALCMTNLFAYRATDPLEMKKVELPIGEDNDKYLKETSSRAGIVVAAWGNHGVHLNRNKQVVELLNCNLLCFRKTKLGQPEHPLYQPDAAQLMQFN